MQKMSERVGGHEWAPYTIHKMLIGGQPCTSCNEEIPAGDLFIPYKDRANGGEVYLYCWECFPEHPEADTPGGSAL